MDFNYTIHEYPDNVSVTADFRNIKKIDMPDFVKRMKSAGFDIKYHFYTDFPGLSDIIANAVKDGKLTLSRGDGVSQCKKCGAGGKYPLYKSGPNKGQENLNKDRIYPQGIKFNSGFISFKNSADYCHACAEEYKIVDMIIGIILDQNLPVEIGIYGHENKTRYIKDQQRKCFSCGNTMFETEMNRYRRMMDNSTYPAQCPHCNAVTIPFGKTHFSTSEFRMLSVPDYLEKVKMLKECFGLENGVWRYREVTINNGKVY